MPEIKTDDLDEDELLSLLERNLDTSDPYSESLIGKQREVAHRYYYGEPLGNELVGRSHHVSRDVFDAVESTKALMLDTFTADRDVCHFTPQTVEDIPKAREATAWVNYLFYRQNPGYRVLYNTIHDGLVSKIGVVKRWWDERIIFEEEDFEDLPEPMFAALASQPDIEISKIKEETIEQELTDPTTGESLSFSITTYSGTAKRRIDRSQVRIESIEPEKLRVSPHATSFDDADFISYETDVEVGELLENGYDEKQVELLDEELDSYRDSTLGRNSIDSSGSETVVSDDHPNRRRVKIYESYMRIYDPDLNSRVTVKAIHSRRVLLDFEVVERHPYRAWCPFPIPHKPIGMSLADVTADIQKSQSSLKRSVIDNAFMTNTTRWLANLSLVRNPRDLIDNRVGAVIDVNAMDPGAVVQPLNVPGISPAVFTTIELLEAEKESRSGSSRMSKGLDSDVVSKQNSSDLITRYMNASNRRTMMMARHFAEDFLMPLMFDLYRLSKENDTQAHIVQLQGDFVEITPAELADRTEMTVAVALTPDARAAEARTLTMLDQMWTANPQDPTLGGMYQTPQRYALLTDALDLMGMKGAPRYLMPPMSEEFQQMQQQQQEEQEQMRQFQMEMDAKKVELDERKVVVEERRAGVEENKLALEAERLNADVSLKTEEMKAKADSETADLMLEAARFRHEQKTDAAHIAIQAQGMRENREKGL